MSYRNLDSVVITRELPDHGLCVGDLGAVVAVHSSDVLEVEFVTASGRTNAVVTLSIDDIRPVSDRDLVSVRPIRQPA